MDSLCLVLTCFFLQVSPFKTKTAAVTYYYYLLVPFLLVLLCLAEHVLMKMLKSATIWQLPALKIKINKNIKAAEPISVNCTPN